MYIDVESHHGQSRLLVAGRFSHVTAPPYSREGCLSRVLKGSEAS